MLSLLAFRFSLLTTQDSPALFSPLITPLVPFIPTTYLCDRMQVGASLCLCCSCRFFIKDEKEPDRNGFSKLKTTNMNVQSKTLRITVAVLSMMAIVAACSEAGNKETETQKNDINTVRKLEKDELIARGAYIVNASLCNDCHSPKIMTAMGPEPDTTRLLSGYPAEHGIPTLSEAVAKDQNWVKMAPDATAFIGPWGISFGANLTPDSTTGLGNWTEEVFIKTIRTGKHLGQDGGRGILPPMPWPMFAKMTDEDLSAVYQYLRSLPAIRNQVPAPIAPNAIKTTK